MMHQYRLNRPTYSMTRETTKRTLTIGTITLVILVIIGYAFITSHNFVSGPSIVVNSINNTPAPEPIKGIVYGSFATSTVIISGVAERIQSISLNGSPIEIDESGHFSEIITLFPGFNAATLSGKDAFGHVTTVELDLNRE